MYYTVLLTLVYAGLHLYKNIKTSRSRHRVSPKDALPLLLLVVGGGANGVTAQHLRLAYFGETVTHYGLRGGMEYNLRHTEKSKPNGRMAFNDFYVGLTLTAYRHPHNHIGLILTPELGWRHTGRRGGIVQAALSPGLFRSFYEGETWQPGENGQFKRVALAGQWGFIPGASVGFGHTLGKPDKAMYCNLHYLRQYPYNHAFLNRVALEVGILKNMAEK